MPYRLDPNTGQLVWDGPSVTQATRDSLGTQIRNLQDQIDDLSFIDLDDVPATYTGQSGKIISVKSTEDGLEFVTNSGGGGGVTDGDKGDVVVSGTGTVWTIDAGAITTAKIADGQVTVAKTSGFGSIATQASSSVTITGGSITGTTVSGITFSGTSTPALAVTGTTAVSGTNTGDQTISLTGDVTGSGTGSFATTLANSGVTAGSYIRATITVDAKGRVTAASSNTAGEINGSAGTVDNAITRADGTGGSAVQGSFIVIDDIDATTQQNVAIRNVDPATNSSVVITPKGTGAFILGPKPDGGTTGGNARGANAVDMQIVRIASNQVAGAPGSCIAGGARNITSGGAGQEYSFVGGGFSNTASGYCSSVFGASSFATGSRSFAAGQSSTASGIISTAFGGSTASATYAFSSGSASVANRLGMHAHANGQIATAGDAQRGAVVMRRQTSDATPVPLSLDGAAPTGSTITTSTHFILLNNQAVFCDIKVVARSTSGTDHAAYMRRVLLKRDANAASTAIIGTVLSPTADIESAGATSWDVAITADTTNGGMLITVTGAAATTINWVASVEFMEIIRT